METVSVSSLKSLKNTDNDVCYCLAQFGPDGVNLCTNAIFSDRELVNNVIEELGDIPRDVCILPLHFFYSLCYYEEEENE